MQTQASVLVHSILKELEDYLGDNLVVCTCHIYFNFPESYPTTHLYIDLWLHFSGITVFAAIDVILFDQSHYGLDIDNVECLQTV